MEEMTHWVLVVVTSWPRIECILMEYGDPNGFKAHCHFLSSLPFQIRAKVAELSPWLDMWGLTACLTSW